MKKPIGAKTIVYPTPVLIVGTYGKDGKPNIMTAAWGGICCSVPPCVAVSLRKATFTHGNITARKCFTVSIPSRMYAPQIDFCGMVSGQEKDKFATCGLTPVKGELVDAPYVGEFPFALECRLLHTIEIGLHTQFVGEILQVWSEEAVLGANGEPDIEKVMPIIYAPGNMAYYAVGEKLGEAFALGKRFRKQS